MCKPMNPSTRLSTNNGRLRQLFGATEPLSKHLDRRAIDMEFTWITRLDSLYRTWFLTK